MKAREALSISCFFLLLAQGACAVQKTASTFQQAAPQPKSEQLEYESILHALRRNDMPVFTKLSRRLLSRVQTPSLRARMHFLAGYVFAKQGNCGGALPLLLQVSENSLPLPDHTLYWQAYCLFKQGRIEEAQDKIGRILGRYPDSIWREQAQFLASEIFFHLRKYGDAGKSLENFLSRHPSSEKAPGGLLRLGVIRELTGRTEQAKALYRRLLVRYPDSPEVPMTKTYLVSLLKEGERMLSPDELLGRTSRLSELNRCQDVLAELAELGKDPSLSVDVKRELLFQRGRCHSYLKQYQSAIHVFQDLIGEYGQGASELAHWYYWLGQAYSRLGMNKEAWAAYDRVIESPSERLAVQGMFKKAKIHFQSQQWSEAIRAYDDMLLRFPNVSFKDEIYWFQAWSNYKRSSLQDAIRTLERLIQEFPKSPLDAQAEYWRGKIHQESGRTDWARAHYTSVFERFPLSLYGSRALRKLENPKAHPLLQSLQSIPAIIREVETSFKNELQAADELQAVQELAAMGLTNLAQKELLLKFNGTRKTEDSLKRYGALFHALEDYYRGFYIASVYFPDATAQAPIPETVPLWALAYPKAYPESVSSAAKRFRVSEALIYAIMREESNFRPEIVSPSFAVGLMQLIAPTGRQMARRLGMSHFETEMLTKPEFNIQFGTAYIAVLLQRFGKQLPYVIAAYNAGPEAVERWLSEYKTPPLDVFIESIPYDETRRYVRRVLNSFLTYQTLYGLP